MQPVSSGLKYFQASTAITKTAIFTPSAPLACYVV